MLPVPPWMFQLAPPERLEGEQSHVLLLKLSGLSDSLILSWEALTTAVFGVFLFFAMSFCFVGINKNHSVCLKTVCGS